MKFAFFFNSEVFYVKVALVFLHLFHPLPFTPMVGSFFVLCFEHKNGRQHLVPYSELPIKSFSLMFLEGHLVFPLLGENMLQDLSAVTV